MPEEKSQPAEPRLPFEAGRGPKHKRCTLTGVQRTAAVDLLREKRDEIMAGRPELSAIALRLQLRLGFALSPNSVPGLCEQAGVDYPTRRPARPAPPPQPQPAPPDVCAPFVVWA